MAAPPPDAVLPSRSRADFVAAHLGGSYRTDSTTTKCTTKTHSTFVGAPHRSMAAAVSTATRGRQVYSSMDAYSRHVMMMNNYVLYYGGDRAKNELEPRIVRRDADVLREEYRFIRSDTDGYDNTWEKRLAKKYYEKLFREYALADLSRYKEGKIGFQWRTKEHVISGKGQFECGNKTCRMRDDLRSYEVNFGYTEANERCSALVKVRLCGGCAYKLFYKKIRKMEHILKKRRREERAALDNHQNSKSKISKSKRRRLNSSQGEAGCVTSDLSFDKSRKGTQSGAEVHDLISKMRQECDSNLEESKAVSDVITANPTSCVSLAMGKSTSNGRAAWGLDDSVAKTHEEDFDGFLADMFM